MMSAMMTSALLALGMSSGATALTVVDLAVATDNLSTLVAALTAGGLVETLNGRGPFTVFAPTNAAFDALGRETLEFLLDPANIAELQNVLTYHVKTDRLRAEDLTNGEQLETIQGQDVGVTIIGSRVFIGDGQVQTADVLATNGIVHIIDRVLIPPEPSAPRPDANLVQLVTTTPDLFVLARLVGASGLAPTLEGDGPFTVFAPSNAAFGNLPGGTIEFLLDPENIDDLVEVLTYHVVAGEVRAGDLCNGQQITTLEGRDLAVTLVGGSRVFINEAFVVAADVLGSNGVAHVIDEVLLPPDMLKKIARKDSRGKFVL